MKGSCSSTICASAVKVVEAMQSLMTPAAIDCVRENRSRAKAKYHAPLSDALRQLANVFILLIPAFIASGLNTGIINIIKPPDIVGDIATQYLNLIGLAAIFGSAILPL